VNGDSIYNGAYDNASGVASLLEVARAFARLPQRPRRSILFMAVTGEEKGLLGSDYFAHQPSVPLTDIVAEINMDMFLTLFPVRDVRPTPNKAPKDWYQPLDADDQTRHSVEDIDANGWEEKKDRYKIGPDPRWNPPAENRVTQKLSPRRYSFTRPFDQRSKGNGARTLNGNHFSMADHRREYEVLGMRPWSQHRNTYRVDPAPWDADMYDVPPESTIGAVTQGRVQAVEIQENLGSNSYRL